jgi:hypothetical protein
MGMRREMIRRLRMLGVLWMLWRIDNFRHAMEWILCAGWDAENAGDVEDAGDAWMLEMLEMLGTAVILKC